MRSLPGISNWDAALSWVTKTGWVTANTLIHPPTKLIFEIFPSYSIYLTPMNLR
jgi:hypothetical protein